MNQAAKVALLLLPAIPCAVIPQSKKTPGPPKVQKKEPQQDPYQILLNQADEAIAKENYSGAIEALEKYTAGRPEEAYGFFQLGYAFTGQKNWERARQAYAKAITLDPKMGAAHLNLGLIQLDQGQTGEAASSLRTAAELLPDRAQVKFFLATALEKSGRVEDAITQYRAAIRQDAQNAEYPLSLGRALLNSAKFVEAQAAFESALKLRPDAAGARLGLAQTFIAQKKWPDAAAELDVYLRAVPDDATTRIQRAQLHLETDAPGAALSELQRLDSAAGASLPAAKIRMDALLRLKRLDEAQKQLEQILVAEPENAEFHALLGRLYLEKRDYPAAEKALLAALRLRPQLTDAVRDLASVYYLGERYEAALRMQDELAKRETPAAFFWFVRATCFDRLGRKPEALEAYEKFVALDQGRSEKQDFQARQRIRILKRQLEKDR